MHGQGRRGGLLLRRRDRQHDGRADPGSRRRIAVLWWTAERRGRGQDQSAAPASLRGARRAHQRRLARLRGGAQGERREISDVYVSGHEPWLSQRHDAPVRRSRGQAGLVADHRFFQGKPEELTSTRWARSRWHPATGGGESSSWSLPVEYSIWISGPHWANLTGLSAPSAPGSVLTPMRPSCAFAMLALLALLAPGSLGAQGFKSSRPDETDRQEQQAQEARESRIAEQLSTPCRAELKGKRSEERR